jgi:hypothetical protein
MYTDIGGMRRRRLRGELDPATEYIQKIYIVNLIMEIKFKILKYFQV